jgi:hypothetical protein
MTFFAGHNGVVQLKRSTQRVSIATQIAPEDVNTSLNRFSFNGAENELLTGDFVTFSTDDPRGIAFLPPSFWSWTSTSVPLGKAGFYANVNQVGGIRAFRNFANSVNNNRSDELALAPFSGPPLPVDVLVEDTQFNPLGKITGYTLNTEREAVETTTLNDKFRQQYSAGLISGNGSIDALFGYDTNSREETPLLMLQLIQRVETGSSFEASLFLTTENAYGSDLDVWYQFQAVVTRAGVEVRSDNIISCAIDFLTTGEIKLQAGRAPSYLLQENQSLINISDFTIDALLKEVDD